MIKTLLNIFYTLLLISMSGAVATYTINLINTPDDLIALVGFVLTAFVCLFGVWVFSQIWGQNKSQKHEKETTKDSGKV